MHRTRDRNTNWYTDCGLKNFISLQNFETKLATIQFTKNLNISMGVPQHFQTAIRKIGFFFNLAHISEQELEINMPMYIINCRASIKIKSDFFVFCFFFRLQIAIDVLKNSFQE